ncbi:MAG: hypothetical protein KF906_10215 [Actinobacteria bacterium]|nr:hypothetical protein [Actinomycetota bacterium]
MAAPIDLDDDEIFRAAAHEGRDRLLTDALTGLREVLNPSRLQTGTDVHASRPTVYQRFRAPSAPGPASGPDRWAAYRELVADEPSGRPDPSGRAILASTIAASDHAWAGWERSFEAIAAALATTEAPHDRIVASIRTHLDHQFRSPGMPAGWVAQAAALTASDRWEGERPADEDLRVARAVLAERRRMYDELTEGIRLVVEVALDELHIRPQPGIDARTIAVVVQCLVDGAVLRALVDPDGVDLDLVAEATYRLAEAFTLPGALDDPSLPVADATARADLVTAARVRWYGLDEPTPVADVAAAAGIDALRADRLFPSRVDLCDRVLRLLVGTDLSHRGAEVVRPVILAATLRRLATVADSHPGVVARSLDPERADGFGVELRAAVARAVRGLNPGADAVEASAQLVAAAGRGAAGRDALDALDRLLGLGLTLTLD